jgi:hypothetical protein
LAGYLVNTVGPVPLVLDLHIDHDRWGSTSDPSINGTLHYPNDIDRSLIEAAVDKIRKYREVIMIITGVLTLSPLFLLLLVRLVGYTVNLSVFYFYKLIGKLTAFLQLQEFSMRNPTVTSSTSNARCSSHG